MRDTTSYCVLVAALALMVGCANQVAAASAWSPGVLLDVQGQVPPAETITLEEYARLKAFYMLPENNKPKNDPTGARYEVALVSFDDRIATAGLVRGEHLKSAWSGYAWYWVRRFEFQRGPQVDETLGITKILEDRTRVIGGVKWGMRMSDVIKLKGLHYREAPHGLYEFGDLVYSDVVVALNSAGDASEVSAVSPVSDEYRRQVDEQPYQDDVVQVYDKSPPAERISLREYAEIKALYSLPVNRYDPNSHISQYVALVRFGDKTATAGVLKERAMTWHSEWVRRFELPRSAEVDAALGVTRVIEDRSKIIGDMKWGMLVSDVIALKGRHFKFGLPEAGRELLCYDDVKVGVGRYFVEYVLPGDGNKGEEMKNVPYQDELEQGRKK